MTLHAITNNKSHNSCCDQIKLSCFLGNKSKRSSNWRVWPWRSQSPIGMTWHSAIFQPYSKKTSAAGLLESLIPRKKYDTTPVTLGDKGNCTSIHLLNKKLTMMTNPNLTWTWPELNPNRRPYLCPPISNLNLLEHAPLFFTLDSKRKATSSMSQALSPPKWCWDQSHTLLWSSYRQSSRSVAN